jgi:histidyl-tRNA synthetase
MALTFSNTLREAVPGLRVETLLGGKGNLKNLFKRADKSGAQFAVVMGEKEQAENTVILKALRDNMDQARWPIDETLFEFLGLSLQGAPKRGDAAV